MCGIFGMIGVKPKGRMIDLIGNIAIRTEVRGKDATGYAALNGKIHVHKAPMKSSDYVFTKEWDRLYAIKPRVFIGHCRYATQGDPADNRNNHPHTSKNGRFALVHNGTLTVNEYADNASKCKSECDSEVILRIIEAKGNPVDGIREVFRRLPDSNYACLLIDRKHKSMYAFRNNGRPLRVWEMKDAGAVIMGSTDEILESGFEDTFDIGSDKVENIDKWTALPGTIYRFDVSGKVRRLSRNLDRKPTPKGIGSLRSRPVMVQKVLQYGQYIPNSYTARTLDQICVNLRKS